MNKPRFYISKTIIHYAVRSKFLLLFSLISTVVLMVLTTMAPLYIKTILDDYLALASTFERNTLIKEVVELLMIYFILTLVAVILRYIVNVVFNLAAMRLELDIRNDAIEKIDRLPVDYYSLEPDGKIVAKITSDSSGVRALYSVVFTIVQSVINLVIVYIGLWFLNEELALYILFITPFVLIWITVFRKKLNVLSVKIRETSSRMTGKLNELVSGALIIQAFNQEEAMLGDYEAMVNTYVTNELKRVKIAVYLGWELLIFLKRVVDAAIIAFFGLLFLRDPSLITAGLIYVYLNYIDRIFQPINQIFNNLNELENALVSAHRVFDFIDEEEDLMILGLESPKEVKGDIRFENITFAYDGINPVLKNIYLHVKPGMTVGVVGHTGSGKSSMMNLLLRFNDYTEGEIYLDDKPIQHYSKQGYREHIGIVLQNPSIFAGTIKSNVTMERDYSDEQVIDILHKVGAEFLLNKFSDGIHSEIKYRGENLSMGEKQLIAFARIMLRNPKILILDEATANIDSETEVLIKEAMKRLVKDRTTFIIAHRLSTIKDADKIVVVDHGKIIDEGTHKALYERCMVYKDIYDSQYLNV